MPRATRRHWLGLLCAGAAAAALSGCGFELRRPAVLQLKRVHLRGFNTYSELGDELRRQLRASPDVVLADSPAQADLVLEALTDGTKEIAKTKTAAGLVRDLTLRTTLRFKVTRPDGHELIAPTVIELARDMTYTEATALAKEHEAQIMFRAMHADIADQVIRRLAAITPAQAALPASGVPAVPAAAASAASAG